MIARDGADGAVRTLSEGPDGEPTRLTAVAARIEAGDEAYLALTPQLLAAASGDMREGLMIGVNRGLTANAAGLLRQTGASLSVANLCRPGSGAGPTEEEPAWTARAISAVEAVQDAALSQQKAACLAALRAG